MKRLCPALLFAAMMVVAPAWGQDWGAVANISATMGVSANRLCYGEASRGDIGCPVDAPTVSGSTITGTFVGDGSGLTGVIPGDSDRIVSGTAKVIANGNTNSISITEAGVTTGYFYGGQWVAGSISTTASGSFNTVSVTNGAYIGGNLGIGTATPSTSLNIMGTSPMIRLTDISGPYSSINGSSGNVYLSSYNSLRNLYFMAGATELMRILGTGQVGIGTISPSATLHVSGSAIVTNWTYLNANVAIRTSPTSPLEVSGTVSATALKLADNPAIMCGPATYGTTKFVNGRPYYCRP